jgi:hypothetical protein
MQEQIISFVRNTLGCGCPDEVFRKIECEEDVAIDTGITVDYRINVGDRLLIYVVQGNDFRVDDDPWNEKKLGDIVEAGKEERDGKGFNRFRLVLAGEGNGNSTDAAADAALLFEGLECVDDRIHLHIIPSDEISFLQENP